MLLGTTCRFIADRVVLLACRRHELVARVVVQEAPNTLSAPGGEENSQCAIAHIHNDRFVQLIHQVPFRRPSEPHGFEGYVDHTGEIREELLLGFKVLDRFHYFGVVVDDDGDDEVEKLREKIIRKFYGTQARSK